MFNLRFTGHLVPKPMTIIIPSTKDQLVDIILCSKKESLEIRVRSGRHSYEGMSSVATDGSPFIIIEMKNLDKVKVNVEKLEVWIEGGATLGQIYLAISKVSGIHTISAGSCLTVGIRGHNSGGGFGHLSQKYGLVADNIMDAILINAEGRALDCDVMGEEVFWALRGGGGGFLGITYAYKMRMVTVLRVITVFKFAFIGAGLSDKVGNHIETEFEGSYLGPIENVISILENVFQDLGLTEESCKELSWIEAMLSFGRIENGTIYDLADHGVTKKSFFKAKHDYVGTPIPIDGMKIAFNKLKKQRKGVLFVEPLGGIMNEITCDFIAFPHRKGNLFGRQYKVNWKEQDNEKNKEYIEWVRETHDTMTPYVSSSPRASYVNCMDLDLEVMDVKKYDSHVDEVEMARVWGEKYFLGNYDRLVRAKTLIDPKNIFRNQQGIFSISNSSTTKPFLESEMK